MGNCFVDSTRSLYGWVMYLDGFMDFMELYFLGGRGCSLFAGEDFSKYLEPSAEEAK